MKLPGFLPPGSVLIDTIVRFLYHSPIVRARKSKFTVLPMANLLRSTVVHFLITLGPVLLHHGTCRPVHWSQASWELGFPIQFSVCWVANNSRLMLEVPVGCA